MQASAGFTKLVVVKRKTMVEELVERHGTRGQARFLAENRGESFAEVEQAHEIYEQARQALRKSLPAGIRFRSSDAAVLELGRSPLIRRLPAEAKPRRSSPSLSSKPGTRATMSLAFTGL